MAAFVLYLGVVTHRDDVIVVGLEKLAGDENAQVGLKGVDVALNVTD